MKARTWLICSISLTVLVGILCVLFNVTVDLYGLYRDTTGRKLLVYGDERISKYLLSVRYVPENFNCLLLGSSVSANWRMGEMANCKIYNESLNGGVIVEEERILSAVLERGRITTVFLIVHPYFTSSHEFKTVTMTPNLKTSALGSLSLVAAYKNTIDIALGREPQNYDAQGTNDFSSGERALPLQLRRMFYSAGEFPIDRVAMDSYFATVDAIHSRSAQVVFIIPPTSSKLLDRKKVEFDRYVTLALSHAAKQDRVIDFSSDAFRIFRDDAEKFTDGVHLTHDAAAELVPMIEQQLSTPR